MSDTAALADVVLPAAAFPEKAGTFTNTERRVQLLNKAVEAPGEARPDWQIVCDIATAMGYAMSYANAAAIMEEIASLVADLCRRPPRAADQRRPAMAGARTFASRYALSLLRDRFPSPSGCASFTVLISNALSKSVGADFPLLLDTGRQLEHYDTGTMTRQIHGLDMRPAGEIEINPEDARRYGLATGDRARLTTRRGAIEARVRVNGRMLEGMVFYPFHYSETRPTASSAPSATVPQAHRPLKGRRRASSACRCSEVSGAEAIHFLLHRIVFHLFNHQLARAIMLPAPWFGLAGFGPVPAASESQCRRIEITVRCPVARFQGSARRRFGWPIFHARARRGFAFAVRTEMEPHGTF